MTKTQLSGGQVGIRLALTDRAKLELLARELDCTPSAVVRRLIRRATPTKAAEIVFERRVEKEEE